MLSCNHKFPGKQHFSWRVGGSHLNRTTNPLEHEPSESRITPRPLGGTISDCRTVSAIPVVVSWQLHHAFAVRSRRTGYSLLTLLTYPRDKVILSEVQRLRGAGGTLCGQFFAPYEPQKRGLCGDSGPNRPHNAFWFSRISRGQDEKFATNCTN